MHNLDWHVSAELEREMVQHLHDARAGTLESTSGSLQHCLFRNVTAEIAGDLKGTGGYMENWTDYASEGWGVMPLVWLVLSQR